MFSVIKNIYNKKTKGPALMEFFTDTGKLFQCSCVSEKFHFHRHRKTEKVFLCL